MPQEIQKVYDDACAMPARNLRITWKATLAFWILFLAVCCLRASAPAPALSFVDPKPVSVRNVAIAIQRPALQERPPAPASQTLKSGKKPGRQASNQLTGKP
jgi:hypothetical protein